MGICCVVGRSGLEYVRGGFGSLNGTCSSEPALASSPPSGPRATEPQARPAALAAVPGPPLDIT